MLTLLTAGLLYTYSTRKTEEEERNWKDYIKIDPKTKMEKLQFDAIKSTHHIQDQRDIRLTLPDNYIPLNEYTILPVSGKDDSIFFAVAQCIKPQDPKDSMQLLLIKDPVDFTHELQKLGYPHIIKANYPYNKIKKDQLRENFEKLSDSEKTVIRNNLIAKTKKLISSIPEETIVKFYAIPEGYLSTARILKFTIKKDISGTIYLTNTQTNKKLYIGKHGKLSVPLEIETFNETYGEENKTVLSHILHLATDDPNAFVLLMPPFFEIQQKE